MREWIHGQTIKKYLKDCYGIDSEIKGFTDNAKAETNYVVYLKWADLALFAEEDDGTLICMNSSGKPVSPDTVFIHAKETDVQIENGEIAFKTDRLNITLDGEEMDLYDVKQLEEKLYPERTSIVLNGMLKCKEFESKPERFYVDEIIYANDEQFDEIQQGKDSELLKAYNEKQYGMVQDGQHGVVVIGENGDGLLVDTQGYDYARYMGYAPKIQMPVDYMLEQEMSRNANIELKLYSPLVVTIPDGDGWEGIEVEASNYFRDIREKVRNDYDVCSERGLAKYFRKNNLCRNKVYSIKPDIVRVKGEVMGVAVVKITKPLDEAELQDLKNYITGQFADGWGESFEQHEVKSCGTEIYVHFWNRENYYIKTSEEMEQMQESDLAEGIQGMSGM